MKRVLEDGARNAGVLIVERDKGIPGNQGRIQGNGLVRKTNLGKRKFTAKVAFLKTREPLRPAAAQTLPLEALVKDLERRKRAFDESRDRCGPFDVDDGECGLRRV